MACKNIYAPCLDFKKSWRNNAKIKITNLWYLKKHAIFLSKIKMPQKIEIKKIISVETGYTNDTVRAIAAKYQCIYTCTSIFH